MKSQIERRRSERLEFIEDIRIRFHDGDDLVDIQCRDNGKGVNLNKNGIMVGLEKEILIGNEVEISYIPTDGSDTETRKARVIHTKKRDDNKYNIGLEFLDV